MATAPSRRTKFILPEDRIPRAWYNIAADLPVPPSPPLHPGTGQPIGPADLAPLFPMALILQEVSTEREIEIPEPVREAYALYRPSPARSGPAGWRRRSAPRPTSTTSTRASARPAATSRTPRSPQAFYNKQEGVKRIATETGAGQWGSALAFAGAMFGLEFKVYMVRASYDQKPYRRMLMETYGAEVVASPQPDDELGRAVLAETPDTPGLARHRDQRGGRGRGDPRRHEVRARARCSTTSCCTRPSSAWRRWSRWRWPARSRTSSSAAPAAAPTSPGLAFPFLGRTLRGEAQVPGHRGGARGGAVA